MMLLLGMLGYWSCSAGLGAVDEADEADDDEMKLMMMNLTNWEEIRGLYSHPPPSSPSASAVPTLASPLQSFHCISSSFSVDIRPMYSSFTHVTRPHRPSSPLQRNSPPNALSISAERRGSLSQPYRPMLRTEVDGARSAMVIGYG
ncbi:hypothetical protein EX30DRAFT_342166 [Ascodesmis nigricans]|uniref:Uncharacterized protein n=1 Tax=Ascodesmis nigricans TaxID=341454 RepID=A0A4S2MTM6_9PEZI|nr:hypothetical protein EX30DRAFT_342166 [Ascodesmis nigricans]